MVNLKKSLGLIVLFFLVSFMLSFLLSNIRGNEVRLINKEDYLTSDYYKVKIKNEGDISKEEFLEIIDDVEIIYKYVEGFGKKGVYYGSNNKYKPSLESGRDFSREDFLEGKYIGIAGDNFIEQRGKVVDGKVIYSEDTFLGGIDIEIVDRIVNTPFDQKSSSFYVNLGAVIDYEGIDGIYYYSGDKEVFSKGNEELSVECLESDRIVWQGLNFFDANNLKLFVSGGIIFLCLILIINMTILWMNSYRKEIAIRRAYGASKLKVFKRLVFLYWGSALLSSIVSVFLYYLLSSNGLLNGFFGILGIKEVIITLGAVFIASNIIFFILCIHSLKKTLATSI